MSMSISRVRSMSACIAAIAVLASLALAAGRATPAAAAPGPFRPVAPARFMDTRVGLGGAAIGPGEVRNLVVAGRGAIPSNAVAVVLNVTATQPSTGGYLTVWPAGGSMPGSSNLNFLADETVPNMVTVGVGTGGAIAIANALGATHVIVDITGYFESGFTGVAPARIMDTRAGLGGATFGPNEARTLTVVGGSVPPSAVAVALNVTATNTIGGGFLTVWPAGAARPPSSNLNFAAGQTVPNMVLVGVGASGGITLANDTGSVDVLVDVMGWFSASGGFTGVVPARLLDTRGASCGVRIGGGETRTLTIAGRGGVPASGVGAVALNVTATNPSAASFLTVWPAGQSRPDTSNLNMVPGRTVPNMVTVGLGAGGQVSIYNASGAVDVLIDVMGYFSGDTPGGTPVPCPPPIITFGEGVQTIGAAVPPGLYKTNNATASCFWERLRGFSGALSDVITNDFGSGVRIVDIKPSDVGFNSSRCGSWSTFVASAYTPTSTFGEGMFAVGSQVAPGRYVSPATGGTSSCYWERLSGFSGEFAETLANDIDSGQRIVDILAGDVGFSSSRCATWAPFNPAAYTPASSFGDGVWAVGSQVVPGRYQATNTTNCFWKRLSAFSGASSSTLANSSGSGTRIVDIAPTDVGISSSRCGTWTRVG